MRSLVAILLTQATALLWPDRFSVHVVTTIRKGRETITGTHDWNRDYGVAQVFINSQTMPGATVPTVAEYVCIGNMTTYHLERVFVPGQGPELKCNATHTAAAPSQIAVPDDAKLVSSGIVVAGIVCDEYSATGNKTYFVSHESAVLVQSVARGPSVDETRTADFTAYTTSPSPVTIPHKCLVPRSGQNRPVSPPAAASAPPTSMW
jgi:hypothetical protein